MGEQPADQSWLAMTAAERQRAKLVAAGRLRPGRPEGLTGWQPLPARTDGVLLSEVVAEMRGEESP
jgi:hypothetical protein